jgi:hypothetical protein
VPFRTASRASVRTSSGKLRSMIATTAAPAVRCPRESSIASARSPSCGRLYELGLSFLSDPIAVFTVHADDCMTSLGTTSNRTGLALIASASNAYR